MLGDVKCPKVSHGGVRLGRGWGSFGRLGPSSLPKNYLGARKLHYAPGQKRHRCISKTSSFANTGLLETKPDIRNFLSAPTQVQAHSPI